jgi:hypothetical protein
MPNDGGNFLLTLEEKKDLIKQDKAISKFIRPFLGAEEFINSVPRFCIWLKDVLPSEYRRSKIIMERITNVRQLRQNSDRETTQKLADIPTLFGEIRQPDTNYLLVPSTSSEKRKYIPIGFINRNTISSNANLLVPKATLYEFGVLTSSMHNAWMRYVCGRLKSDYRYSASIVYNNFVWAQNITEKQKLQIEKYAQQVLDIRKKYPDNSLADLYDPLTMPRDLLKAHQELDKAVDKAYGKTFSNDSARVTFLFDQYKELTKDLLTEKGKRKK